MPRNLIAFIVIFRASAGEITAVYSRSAWERTRVLSTRASVPGDARLRYRRRGGAEGKALRGTGLGDICAGVAIRAGPQSSDCVVLPKPALIMDPSPPPPSPYAPLLLRLAASGATGGAPG